MQSNFQGEGRRCEDGALLLSLQYGLTLPQEIVDIGVGFFFKKIKLKDVGLYLAYGPGNGVIKGGGGGGDRSPPHTHTPLSFPVSQY